MTTQDAQTWWARRAVTADIMDRYAASETRPYRARVLGALREIGPWGSLFEIGCGLGSMLSLIQDAHPAARLTGCDLNDAMVTHAKRRWPGVAHGPFPEITRACPPRCVDVVLSCYALAYLDPHSIRAALEEAHRLCRRGLVICEPVAWTMKEAGWRGAGDESMFSEWKHPYLRVLTSLPGLSGWEAHCWPLSYGDNLLSGLIVVKPPAAEG